MAYPIFLILLCLPLVHSNSVRKIRGLSKTPPQSANVRSATLKTLIRNKKKLAYNKRKAAALKIANAEKGQQQANCYMNEYLMRTYDCTQYTDKYTDIYDYFITKFGNEKTTNASDYFIAKFGDDYDVDSKYFYHMYCSTNTVYGHAKIVYGDVKREYDAALIIAQNAQRTSNTAERMLKDLINKSIMAHIDIDELTDAKINLNKATEEAKIAKQLLVKANKDVINAACILNIAGATCLAAENMHENALKKAKAKVQS